MELSVSSHLSSTSSCLSPLLKTRVRVSQTTVLPFRFQQPLSSTQLRHRLGPIETPRTATTRASVVEDNGSPVTNSPINTVGGRIGEVKRVTKEINVSVRMNLDGSGVPDSSTGISFFDHMLDQLPSHGLFDVHVKATGDIHIDDHHTNEDVALAIGTALLQALGDRKGINRFGDFSAPLDEALIHVSLDLSGRPHLSDDLRIPTERVGTYDKQLVEHFFQSLVNTSGMTLHIRQGPAQAQNLRNPLAEANSDIVVKANSEKLVPDLVERQPETIPIIKLHAGFHLTKETKEPKDNERFKAQKIEQTTLDNSYISLVAGNNPRIPTSYQPLCFVGAVVVATFGAVHFIRVATSWAVKLQPILDLLRKV